MIETEVKSFQSIIEEGLKRVLTTKEKLLVTYTEKISFIEPLIFFERARNLKENRTFWKSATEPFYLITVGELYHVKGQDEQRYKDTFKEWKKLRKSALIYNPYNVEGTGLILSGGMSFDVKEKRTALWEKYPPSEFVVPRFTYTIKDGTCYLTTTVLLSEEDETTKINERIKRDKEILTTLNVNIELKNTIKSKSEVKPEQWKKSVQEAIDYIQSEKAEKIVMARKLIVELEKDVEITPILKQFLSLQKTSYIFAYERGNHCFIGATPERLVRVNGKKLLSTCLAGTAPRGKTEEEDKALHDELFHDEKNRLEHDHVVQMIHRSIKDYCTFLDIPEKPQVIQLQDLQHLYTPVVGELKPNFSVFDIIQQLHPTPALGGAPTDVALRFIRENETFERGWYGSPVGWLDDRHNGEFAVAIRSGLIQGDKIFLFAGCGVMGDSDVDLEFQETAIKFLPMLTALEE